MPCNYIERGMNVFDIAKNIFLFWNDGMFYSGINFTLDQQKV